MGAMVVEVVPELEEFIFEICGRPEQRVIQILAYTRDTISLRAELWAKAFSNILSESRSPQAEWTNRMGHLM
jgi:hypothetical protein